jgi:thiosulfate dehydrogenase [quinone] large subunit
MNPRSVTSSHGGASVWGLRLAEPGWLLLPLRGFLGVTFGYAGLQKLANPSFLDPQSPASIARQMSALRGTSPIGPLLAVSAHAPVLVGLAIAAGELAVGIGALLGLYVRIAAAGGALLALTFFLTVSWATRPYYYGADIVFVFAWLTLLGFGDRGVLSLQAWSRHRARASLGMEPSPVAVPVSAQRLHALCGRGPGCGLRPDGICRRAHGCPVFPVSERIPPSTAKELNRRTALRTGSAATAAAGAVVALAGLTAWIGRIRNGRQPAAQIAQSAAATQAPGTTPPSSPGSPTPTAGGSSTGTTPTRDHPTSAASGSSSATSAPAGTPIGAAAAVPPGQARTFTDPATGDLAWLVHPSGNQFLAFDAVCTHAGCTVEYDQAGAQFICPCHGGVYDARTGQVLQGPPPAPLRSIPVRVVGGRLWVDA